MGIDTACLADCQGLPNSNNTCIESCFRAAGWTGPQSTGPLGIPTYASVLISAGLLVFSGLFSGLNLGLLSLDLVSLRILERAGEPKEREWASSLIPVRARGNQLLCTILLGNTVVNSGISILLADVTTGIFGLLVSTFAILLLGEIIPQAYFCRNSLKFGAKTLWLTKTFIFLFWPVCFPIAYMLDKVLDRDIGTVYTQDELKHLIEIHAEDPDAQKESGLTPADRRLLTGVFEYKDKKVKDVMTKLEECFCLERSMRLNFHTLSGVYLSGCSRIPVYHGDRQNIVGILFVKDLILVDPDDELEVSTVMAFRARTVSRVYEDVTLDKVLSKFLSGRSHMLIAHAPPASNEGGLDGPAVGHTPITGLITLEDVMEELISEEIYDETDAAVEPKGDRRSSNKQHQQAMFMNLFDHKMRGSKLSAQEVQAVCSFLALNIEEFRSVASSDLAFRGLVRAAEVLEKSSDERAEEANFLDASVAPYGSKLWQDTASGGGLLYERGKVTPYFTLILQGKVMIHTGDEGFDLDLGPWSHMGNKALHSEQYVPNFDAVAVPPYRIVRIHRAAFMASLDAMRLEHARGFQSIRQHISSMSQLGVEEAPGGQAAAGPQSSGTQHVLPFGWDTWPTGPPTPTAADQPDTASIELVANPAVKRTNSFSALAESHPGLPTTSRQMNPMPSFVVGPPGPGRWGPDGWLPPRPGSAGHSFTGPNSNNAPAAFWPRPLSLPVNSPMRPSFSEAPLGGPPWPPAAATHPGLPLPADAMGVIIEAQSDPLRAVSVSADNTPRYSWQQSAGGGEQSGRW